MRPYLLVTAFLTLCFLAGEARTETPPPLIGEIRRAPRPVVTEPMVEAPARAEPADGPMCEAPLPPDGPYPDFFGVLVENPATQEEREVIYRMTEACTNASHQTTDPYQMLALLRLEEMYGVPTEARGITLGVMCIEVSLREKAASGRSFRGDWENGEARAHGPFQLHGWFRAWCGATPGAADDLLWSAGCYLSRVQDVLPKASGCKQPWRVAEAATANYRRYGYRCDSASKHWQVLDASRKK